MKLFVVSVCALFACACGFTIMEKHVDSDATSLFNQWKTFYNKKYNDAVSYLVKKSRINAQ